MVDDDDRPAGLRVVPGGRGEEQVDARISAVLEVLGGASAAEAALRWGTEPALVHRWVRAFVEGGTAAVTNTPTADAARQRDRFLAAFAHELRTPLAVAQGWVDVLAEGDVPPAVLERAVETIEGSLGRLGERLVEVELMASASLGRLELDRQVITAGQLLAEVGGPREVLGDGPEVELDVDPRLFSRVLADIWLAAHLPPEPRSVELRVRYDDPWVDLQVVRDAEPIDSGVLQALFDPFDFNNDNTGVTLGLYLARALVIAHGGTLGVDQDDDRACFWVRVQRTLVL